MKKSFCKLLGITALLASSNLYATIITTTSPTSAGALTSSFTEVGGIVLDLIGTNGTRLTSQLAAGGLYDEFSSSLFDIGTQTGYTSTITDALGGGFSEAAVRVTLWDGDTASGEFDEDNNDLLLNGLIFGNWSDVNAQSTDSSGVIGGSFSAGGFRDDTLDTGWFYSNDATLLDDLFDSIISTESVIFQLADTDGGDNYLDFTQGVDGGLINIGTGPSVTPVVTVPEPGTLAIFILGLAALVSRRKFGRSTKSA